MKVMLRTVAAIIGLAALILQYWLVMTGDTGPDSLNRTINFFSYFTILTNIIVFLSFATVVSMPNSGMGEFLNRANVRTAIAAYIVVVAIVYHLVLRDLWSPEGLACYVDITLHYVIPALFVIDWLFFALKAEVDWSAARKLLFYPIAYLGWTLVHGEATGFYPYPFLDVGKEGMEQVLINSAGTLVAFVVIGLIFIGIARLIDCIDPGPEAAAADA